MAKSIAPEKAEKIFKSDVIGVRMDSIVIRIYAGMKGSIEEDGKGGLNIYRPNNDYEWVWRIKDEAVLNDLNGTFSNQHFEEDHKVTAELENCKLDIYYGADGTPEKSAASSTHVTVNEADGYSTKNGKIDGENMKYYVLFENNRPYIQSDRVVNSMTLLLPDTPGMKKTGYHLDKGAEWIRVEDNNVFAAGKSYRPTLLFPDSAYEDSKLCLYANWKQNTYEIIYHSNDGTDAKAKSDTKYFDGEAFALDKNGFTRSGYTFAGWATSKNGPVDYIDKQGGLKNLTEEHEGQVHLYAVWVPDVSKITLDKQGGTGGTDQYFQKYEKGNFAEKECVNSILEITEPEKPGHTFLGYFTFKDGNGTQYISSKGKIDETKPLLIGDTVLYADWQEHKYTIKYHANGGTGSMADTPAIYGKEVFLRTNIYERIGYTFAGWAKSENGPKVYDKGASVKDLTTVDGGVVNLYAVWEPVHSMITLDPQGGTGGTGFFYAKYGVNFYTNELFTTLISQITIPEKPGYDFKGYYKDIAGNGSTLIGANGIISAAKDAFAQDTTLFAKWQAKSYTVTFDKQGGTNGSDSVTATYKKRMPASEAPTRAGFTFKGYYAQKNGAGTKYYDEFMNSDVIYESTQNTTLYAYWVDETAPMVILKANVDEANPWTNQPVSLNAIAEDLGTGLSSVYIYQIGDNDSLSCVASATGLNGAKSKELTFTNTKEGVVRYKAVATDMTGKTSESYNTVFYDKTAPTGDVGVSVSGNTFYFNIIITDINPGN